jgi:hypothetical protein
MPAAPSRVWTTTAGDIDDPCTRDYDPLIRSWVTVPDSCTVFAPALDGELTTAPDALTEAARDLGRATYTKDLAPFG